MNKSETLQASYQDLTPFLCAYGLFHAVVAPIKTFGVVMSVTFPGVMMDIGHLRHLRVAKDNDTQTWINYNRMRGQQQSYLEAATPEHLLADTSAGIKLEGISTVKALAIAAAQGQKVFVITSGNIAVALPQLQHNASVLDEIRNAVAAGKEVTISEKPVTVAGWTGAGYSIIDPVTGAGGYLIEGGVNGGILFALGAIAGGLVAATFLALSSTSFTGPLGVAATAILLGMMVAMLIPFVAFVSQMWKDATVEEKKCFWGGLFVGIGVVGLPATATAAVAGRAIAIVSGFVVGNDNANVCYDYPSIQ